MEDNRYPALSRLTLVVGCCAAVLAGCTHAGGKPPAVGQSVAHPSSRPSPGTSHAPPAVALASVLKQKIAINSAVGSPDGMALGAGSLWVGGYQGSAIAQVDPATGRYMRTISVGTSPLGVSVLAGSVWAANFGDGTVSRIDPTTGRVTKTIRVGVNPDSFAMIGHDLWVFNQGGGGTATVLDPATGQVLRTVQLPVMSGFASAGAGRVWVPDLAGSTGTVLGLDRSTGKVAIAVRTGNQCSEVAFGFGSGWVTCQNAVYRFNPSTGGITARINSVGAGFDGIAFKGGSVWVGDLSGGLVDQINPDTNTITSRVSTGGGPRHILMIGGDLWVALFDDGVIVRMAPHG